jgi:tetratricopeptide (TPR) repeat protein
MTPRGSSTGWIAGVVWLIAYSSGISILYPYAHSLGLTGSVALSFWILFCVLDFLVLLVHELGHALATWAVGYRLKVICAGPVTIRRDVRGRRIMFDWSRVLSGGGFVGAIPSSPKDLRANAMLIVFAGPFVTLLCAAVLFLLLINLPGTALARWWEPVALGLVLFGASFFRNMTPVGTADGNRLLQLTLRNRAGEEFLNLFAASTDMERAEEARASVDLDDEVASRLRVVERIKSGGGHDRLPLAVAWQNLGIAQFQAADPAEAEASLQESLRMLQNCRDVHPALEGNVWSVLCHLHRERHQADGVESAYRRALDAFERAEKKGGVDPVQRRLVVASLHLHAGHPELALDEIETGFAVLPSGAKHAMNRATLLRLRSECDFAMGQPARGLAAAREAAELLRSAAALENNGRRAVAQLVALGASLWKGGQGEEGILVFSEAVTWLEQHGASPLAARCRIGLAAKLCKAGRLGDAEAALPPEADLPAYQWGTLCAVRGSIRLAQLRFEDATADFARGIQLRGAGVRPNPVSVAVDKSGLAQALFGCGRVADAEREALEALDILLPSAHPDASEALLTLALIGWQRGEQGADAQFEQALRCIANAPLLEPALKARHLEDEARRLRHYGRVNEAARADAQAKQQWRLLDAGADHLPQTKLAESVVEPLPV